MQAWCNLSVDSPNRIFNVEARDYIDGKMREAMQALVDHITDSDEFRDEVGIPRVGREPDYLNGRFCLRCRNSLPMDTVEPCDVCGAPTVFRGSFEGLLYEKGTP